jgi:CheY-like chemotaxis protein
MPHRILLADDSLTIQKVIELTFSGTDFELKAVGNGDLALPLLDSFSPDIVLADCVMPGKTGYELCEEVKRRPGGRFVPVVLLTGTFEPFDKPRAEQAGADSVVTKPFDSQGLASLVRDLVNKAAEQRAAAPPEPPPALEPPSDSEAAPPPPSGSPTEPIPVPEPTTAAYEMDLGALDDEPPHRDLEADIAAFEASGRSTTRPDLWDTPAVKAAVASSFAEPAPGELEALTAEASLTDLKSLIPKATASAAATPAAGPLTDDDIDRIARRVLELSGERIVRKIAWDVVPELAERLVKERLDELDKAE